MNDWKTVKLGQVADFINGDRGRNYPSEGDFVDWGIPFINAGHLADGKVDFSNMNYIRESRFQLLGSGKTRENDILYCLRGSLGKTAIYRKSDHAAIASSLVIIRPGKECTVDYLYHFLTSPRGQSEIRKFDNGSSQPNLSAGSVKDYVLPLPPLEEQRRVATILDKADELRAKRHAAIAQLDTLIECFFFDLFGDPATNPKRWPIKEFGSEISSVRYGTGSPPEYVDNGFPFIRATNVKSGTVNPKDLKRIPKKEAERLEKCKVKQGDLIVVRSGVNTGDCALIPPEYDGAYAAFDLVVQLPFPSAVFYNFLINSRYGKALLYPLTRRAAQPHLNAEQLRSLVFISPPEALREEFTRKVKVIAKLKAAHLTSLFEMAALFASLQHRAFRGEL